MRMLVAEVAFVEGLAEGLPEKRMLFVEENLAEVLLGPTDTGEDAGRRDHDAPRHATRQAPPLAPTLDRLAGDVLRRLPHPLAGRTRNCKRSCVAIPICSRSI